MCIRSITCFITSMGHGAPAMIPVRNESKARLPERRVLELGDEHRRYAVDRCAPMGLNRLQRRFWIERFGRQDDRGAVRHRGEVRHHASEAVVKRHRDTDPICLGVFQHFTDEKPVVQDVVMRQCRAFWRSGCSRGVLDVDRIIELKLAFTSGERRIVDAITRWR